MTIKQDIDYDVGLVYGLQEVRRKLKLVERASSAKPERLREMATEIIAWCEKEIAKHERYIEEARAAQEKVTAPW